MTEKAKRPIFLVITVLIVAAQICALFVALYIAIFATPESTFQITDESMVVGDVRTELVVVLVLWLAFTAYVGLGLWRGNSITRHVFVGSVVAILLIETFIRRAFIELPLVALTCGIVAWYFYARPNVKQYFEET